MYLNISKGRVYFEDQYMSIVDWHDNDEFLFFILYNDFVDISVYDYLESKNEIN